MAHESRSLALSLSIFFVGTLGGTVPFEARAQDHSAHHKMMKKDQARYSRSMESYEIPHIVLTDQHGKDTPLVEMFQSSEPVAVNFIFTTCTTICPVMSATFSQMLKELGSDAGGLRLVSISIDPEHDTPERLREYAAKYKAGANWMFLTGKAEEVASTQKAFDAHVGNKMGHEPLTFFRVPGNDQWLRVDGLTSGRALADEYRKLLAQ